MKHEQIKNEYRTLVALLKDQAKMAPDDLIPTLPDGYFLADLTQTIHISQVHTATNKRYIRHDESYLQYTDDATGLYWRCPLTPWLHDHYNYSYYAEDDIDLVIDVNNKMSRDTALSVSQAIKQDIHDTQLQQEAHDREFGQELIRLLDAGKLKIDD